MGKAIQFNIGDRILNTRLSYLQETVRTDPKRRRGLFQCDCGNTIDTDINWVRFGNVTSCGCYRSEVVAARNTKHRHAVRGQHSGAYRSWQAMHQRVKVDPNYLHISICASWYDFEKFILNMGDRPEGLTIERVDNSVGYTPGNCIWATHSVQAQNTRTTHHVTLAGETHSISEWCRLKNIGYHLVKQRRARGMSLEDAITTPINPSKQGRKK